MLWNDEKSDRLLSSVLFRYLKWNRVGENKGGGIICKEILLEDAVRDEKGKIKVYEYGMGEKG